jgi:putative restriction endonuclease
LLILLALGRIANSGTSRLEWATAHEPLGDLIAEFGPASKTKPMQSAAYPFTHLRSDGIWMLDQDVPMDRVGTLTTANPTGQLTPGIEDLLLGDPRLLASAARTLVEAHFPPSVAADVLAAVGLDPEAILHAPRPAGDTSPA